MHAEIDKELPKYQKTRQEAVGLLGEPVVEMYETTVLCEIKQCWINTGQPVGHPLVRVCPYPVFEKGVELSFAFAAYPREPTTDADVVMQEVFVEPLKQSWFAKLTAWFAQSTKGGRGLTSSFSSSCPSSCGPFCPLSLRTSRTPSL